MHANIRRKILAYADPFYRPQPKPTEIPTEGLPKKIPDSNINSLEQDINTYFEENSPHQGVISEIYKKARQVTFPRTTRIAKSSEHRQISANGFTKTG